MAVRQRQDASETLKGAGSPVANNYGATWLDELEDLATQARSLPVAARHALVGTITAFEVEDGFLPAAAARARDALAATPLPPADNGVSSADP